MVFVYGEVGVGGGVIIDGVPLGGASGLAGEIGHVPVDPAGTRCRCGAIGCWETFVGERALLERAGLDPGLGSAGVRRLLEDATAGTASSSAAIAEHARWVAFGLAGLINVLDPDVIVLGGLFGAILPHASDEIVAGLAHHRFRGVERDVRIVAAALGSDATPVGAAELAFAPLLADPVGYVAHPDTA
jgi:predicted NBD/HSP70 family sugar kinase